MDDKIEAEESAILGSLGLKESEGQIIKYMIKHLKKGRKKYGIWDPEDKKDWRREALEEVIDALNYCAMALITGTMEREKR